MNCYQENQWIIGMDFLGRTYYRDYNRPYSLWTTHGGHRFQVDFPDRERAMLEMKWYLSQGYEDIEMRFYNRTQFTVVYGLDPESEYEGKVPEKEEAIWGAL